MSLDIYATPDLSKKVRYNREVQEDKVEWEERQVDIYESTDAIGNNHTDIQSLEGGPHTEKHPPAVQRRPFRVAAYCLGVLCLVMMTGIILLSVLFTLGRDKLHSRYDQLSKNYSQLQRQISNVSVHYSQVQDEVKQLQNKIEGKWCPDGWSKFGCSCYFKMNEEKNWDRSRADCRQRGADLVVINNKEEQKFVTELNVHGESWIGLQETWTGGRWEWEQKWVDGSPLTEMFWAPGLPTHEGYQHAATCCNDQGQWTQSLHHVYKNWICEK
ncbi:CD209 antigen-like protein C isoform X1 [Epinephelus fuscoguttatus]|uniref:CD209 antigen-like protein C isoform X1 n=1 Tax=Epinephelus fuscoguttatus TaxID=293821 RepID=UPI0020D0075B|nr:CD209 antigen-like protein C isoform X1 [Epinephelus fuscoguttatus]